MPAANTNPPALVGHLPRRCARTPGTEGCPSWLPLERMGLRSPLSWDSVKEAKVKSLVFEGPSLLDMQRAPPRRPCCCAPPHPTRSGHRRTGPPRPPLPLPAPLSVLLRLPRERRAVQALKGTSRPCFHPLPRQTSLTLLPAAWTFDLPAQAPPASSRQRLNTQRRPGWGAGAPGAFHSRDPRPGPEAALEHPSGPETDPGLARPALPFPSPP